MYITFVLYTLSSTQLPSIPTLCEGQSQTHTEALKTAAHFKRKWFYEVFVVWQRLCIFKPLEKHCVVTYTYFLLQVKHNALLVPIKMLQFARGSYIFY